MARIERIYTNEQMNKIIKENPHSLAAYCYTYGIKTGMNNIINSLNFEQLIKCGICIEKHEIINGIPLDGKK
jgi:hypothetical protein